MKYLLNITLILVLMMSMALSTDAEEDPNQPSRRKPLRYGKRGETLNNVLNSYKGIHGVALSYLRRAHLGRLREELCGNNYVDENKHLSSSRPSPDGNSIEYWNK